MSPTAATLNGQELELFEAGNYGKKGAYSVADLKDLAARYAATGEAALTIGHPASDSEPAWGWVKSLRVEGSKLLGTIGEVNSHFDGLVQGGAYKHRSIGISRGADGKLRLRHVAFLGAVPPHVQGLQPAKFSSDPYEEFAISEGESMADEQQLKKSIGEGIREYLSEMFSGKKDAVVVDAEKIVADVTARLESKFSSDLKAERDAREKVEKDFAAHKAEFSAGDVKSRVAAAINDLKAKGAWVPAYEKLGVEQLFVSLAGSDEAITFSDKDGKEQKPHVFDAALAIFSAVGRIVPKDQLVQQGAAGEQSKALPEANGATVDASSATFSAMVSEHAAKNKMSYGQAYRDLTAQGKRSEAGSAAAGAV